MTTQQELELTVRAADLAKKTLELVGVHNKLLVRSIMADIAVKTMELDQFLETT